MKRMTRMAMSCFALAWMVGFSATAGAQNRQLQLTLDQAIEIALNDNPTIRVAEQEIELKKVSYKEAWQNLLPTVDVSGSVSYSITVAEVVIGDMKIKMGKDETNTWNAGLNVGLPIYAPAVYRTMKMTKDDILLAGEKSRASRIDLVNQVTKAYYQLMLSQDSYEVLQKSYEVSEKNFNVVNEKYKQGAVSEYDKISAEVQMRNIKPNVVSAANAIHLSKIQLKVLLGISDANLDIVVNDNLKNYENEVADYVQPVETVNLADNTTLRQLEYNSQLLNHSLRIQKTNFIPTVALGYNFAYQSMSNKNFRFWDFPWSSGQSVALNVSVPLFKASNFTKIKSARIQLEQLNETRIHTERQLGMQAVAYTDNMKASAEQLSSNKESMAQAEKGRMIAEKRYDVGKGTILELNTSEVALTQAQLTYHQSIYDFLVAKADLNSLVGVEQ